METFKYYGDYYIYWRIELKNDCHGFYNHKNSTIGYNYKHQYKGFTLRFETQ
jgi:hypothetical protein